MSKIVDVSFNNCGNVRFWRYGFFEEIPHIVPYNPNDYIVLTDSDGYKYRCEKYDLMVPWRKEKIEKEIAYGVRERKRKKLRKAKRLIDDYVYDEFGSDADFSNLEKIPITYTTITDYEIEIQVYINLKNPSIIQELSYEGKTYTRITNFDSIDELIEKELEYISFDDLIDVPTEYLDMVLGTEH